MYRKLGDILVDEGAVSSDQLQEALARQPGTGKMIGELLIELGFATTEQVDRALTMQFEQQLDQPPK